MTFFVLLIGLGFAILLLEMMPAVFWEYFSYYGAVALIIFVVLATVGLSIIITGDRKSDGG